MYNFYNYPIPDEHQGWRSAYEIEMAAIRHEKRRMQILNGEAAWGMPQARARKAGFLSFLKAPLQMLAALMG